MVGFSRAATELDQITISVRDSFCLLQNLLSI
jgi:hypothetical protein